MVWFSVVVLLLDLNCILIWIMYTTLGNPESVLNKFNKQYFLKEN